MLRVWSWQVDPQRLRQAREWAEIGSRELSRRLGQPENYISKLETGKLQEVSEKFLIELADQLAGNGKLRRLDRSSVLNFMYGTADIVEPEPSLEVVPLGAPVPTPTGASFTARTVHPLDAGGPKEGAPAETEAPRKTPAASTRPEDQMSYSVPRRLRPVPSPSRVIRHHPDRTRRCAPLLAIDDVDDAWDLSPWCIRGHLLTPANTTHWKSDKGRTRRCKKCERDRARRRRIREREKRSV